MVWHGNYEKLFIGGQWVAPTSSHTLTVTSPVTEEPVAEVPAASREDIDRAVAAARAAFDHGPWPGTPLPERIEIMRRLSAAFEERMDLIAALVTEEMGCPISTSKWMQAASPKAMLDAFIEVAPDYPFGTLRRSGPATALVTREPVGVVAAVVPWNAPLLISMIKVAPALLAGCSVILKPAPETPLDAYLLGELLAEAGVPPGTVNVVPADREESEYLVAHPGVDKVAFTGSTATGRRIAAICGQDLRRCTLELGGKSAAVILDDADLDATVESLRLGSFRNSGQVCSNKTRILISRARESELLERLDALVDSMPVGDPSDDATQIGPLVSRRQRDRVEGYLRTGQEQGATLVRGGGRPAGLDRGWFVEPAIFSGVDSSMTIAQEEIFGPVVSVLSYRDEEEAVAIANDSTYGLSGSVFSADAERALRLARRLRTGVVELNGSPVGVKAPLGGFKSSGIGREVGPEGFDAFVEVRSIGLPQSLAETGSAADPARMRVAGAAA